MAPNDYINSAITKPSKFYCLSNFLMKLPRHEIPALVKFGQMFPAVFEIGTISGKSVIEFIIMGYVFYDLINIFACLYIHGIEWNVSY